MKICRIIHLYCMGFYSFESQMTNHNIDFDCKWENYVSAINLYLDVYQFDMKRNEYTNRIIGLQITESFYQKHLFQFNVCFPCLFYIDFIPIDCILTTNLLFLEQLINKTQVLVNSKQKHLSKIVHNQIFSLQTFFTTRVFVLESTRSCIFSA